MKINRIELSALNSAMSQISLKGIETHNFLKWMKAKEKVNAEVATTQNMLKELMKEFNITEGVKLSQEIINEVQPKVDVINNDFVKIDLEKFITESEFSKMIENNNSLTTSIFELIYKFFVIFV